MDNAAYLFDNRQNYFYFTTKLFISTCIYFFISGIIMELIIYTAF